MAEEYGNRGLPPVTQLPHIMTSNGKPVWKDNANWQGEMYSERTETIEMGDGWVVIPTVDSNTGDYYPRDKLLKHYKNNGPYDLFNGDKLPVHESIIKADEYAQWRSDNILNPDMTAEGLFYGPDGEPSRSLGEFASDTYDNVMEVKNSIAGFMGFGSDGSDPAHPPQEYASGGLNLADAMKGRSEEDKEIAEEKDQVDVSKADTDGNGFVDGGERELAKAKKTGELLDEDDMPVKMYHGGMACGCDGACDGSCEMSGYDEVSGNPIPVGSTAENVRDDIDAKLSKDEYVLPAHVVKWHGLRHIMDLQAEAEMGLMSMKMDGLIQDGQEEPYGEGIENAPVSYESDTEQEEGVEETEAPEVATVKVDDLLDDDEDKEISPKSKPLPAIVKRQKVVFAI